MYEKNQRQTMSYSKETIEDVLKYKCLRVPEHVPLEAAEYFGIRSSVSEKDGKTIEATYFPYFDQQNRLVGFKKRDWTKPKSEKGHFTAIGKITPECKMFGQHKASSNPKKIILVEGECFLPTAEVLTPEGWVAFQDYDQQKVMQVNPDGSGSFVDPLAVVDKQYNGNMVAIESGSYKSTTTENHNMVFVKDGVFHKETAKDIKKQRAIPRVLNGVDCGGSLDLLTRLRVMISADFTLRAPGDLYANFSKQRKIKRAKELLDLAGVRYSSNIEPSTGKQNFFVHRGHGLDVAKLFKWEWLQEMDHKVFLEEILFWDGNSVPNRNQIEYVSKEIHNATFVQTIAHLNGYTSTIIPRKNQCGSWFKVSILFGKQISQPTHKKDVEYSGRVMCVTVPSGMLLVRQERSISVSGNCDTAVSWYAIQEHLKGLDKKYHPSFAIVGLPLGCGNAAACASTNAKWLLSAQEIILALDTDERLPHEKKNVVRGKEATEDIYSVLLSKKVKSLEYPEGNKDGRDYATACLQDGNVKPFYDLLFYGAKSYSGGKIASPHDYSFEDLEAPIPEGLYIDEFPKLMELVRGIRKYELSMVTAPSGAGKTTVVSTIMGGIANKDQKVGIIFLEEENLDTLKRMQAYKMQVPFDDLFFNPAECGTVEERRAAWDWVAERNEDGSSKRFSLMNHFGSIHTQELMDKIKQLVFIEKCDYIVLDHISIVVSGNESDNERKDIDMLLTNLASFVAVNPVGIIAVSHINRVGSTSAGPKKGKEDQPYWVEVKKEHLRGSSAIEGLCWNIWAVEPEILPDRSRGRIRLVGLKNRKAKKLGVADVLKMNETTGVLEDASEQQTGEAEF